jgi:hypothetical protein
LLIVSNLNTVECAKKKLKALKFVRFRTFSFRFRTLVRKTLLVLARRYLRFKNQKDDFEEAVQQILIKFLNYFF